MSQLFRFLQKQQNAYNLLKIFYKNKINKLSHTKVLPVGRPTSLLSQIKKFRPRGNIFIELPLFKFNSRAAHC